MTGNNVSTISLGHKLLVWLTISVILITAGVVAFYLLYPYTPTETPNTPYKIVVPMTRNAKGLVVLKQGEYFTYEFAYVKNDYVIPTITRQFVDGIVFNVSGYQQPTVMTPGRGTARVAIQVPETLPPGEYHLSILATYQENPIRVIHNDHITETFEVVAVDSHADIAQDKQINTNTGAIKELNKK